MKRKMLSKKKWNKEYGKAILRCCNHNFPKMDCPECKRSVKKGLEFYRKYDIDIFKRD